MSERMLDHLTFLYGPRRAAQLLPELAARLQAFRTRPAPPPSRRLSERDVFVIAYGDHLQEAGWPPLQTLASFLDTHLGDQVGGVHLLPFFPASSDDGFSVIDYRQTDPQLGTWADVAHIGQRFRLMFDAVLNHVSRQSAWFQSFVRGEPTYEDYFIVVPPDTDLSQVVRPRTRPLLTPVETRRGLEHVWTTFSDDQIDLDFCNPQVLLEIIDLLLFYVERGAEVLRLDAIAYLWKGLGTSCIHLPQVHRIVQLFRTVLNTVAPGVLLLTETNVPHEENIRYFGDGTDEAQMVYQFPLPPLVLHTLHTGSARILSEWAGTLRTPSDETAFFNFLASHDGIGMSPARGLLSPREQQSLVERILAHGGQVSFKTNPDQSRSVYELNITLFDALNDPRAPQPEIDVRRFLASQAIMLALAGVPGIYLPSLWGARNCHRCVEHTGQARSINREKFDRPTLERGLSNPTSTAGRLWAAYRPMLRQRRSHPAFHPHGAQEILTLDEGVFGVRRRAPDGREVILCLVNVTAGRLVVRLPAAARERGDTTWHDLVGGRRYSPADGGLQIPLEPYQVMWLHAPGVQISSVHDLDETTVIGSFEDMRQRMLKLIMSLPEAAFQNKRIVDRLQIEVIGHLAEHALTEGKM